MSLINDALKRASSAKPTPAPPPGGPPMQPVESGSDRASPFPIILCIVGIGALLMAGGFWLKSRGTPHTAAAEKSSTPVTIAETKPAPNTMERATTTLQKVVERNSETNPSAPTTIASTATAASPISTPAAEPVKPQPTAPPTPTFHLQAIYYRMKGPTVVINGKTLKIGDRLDGAKLVSIERNSAEIEYEGKTQRLTVQ